jgi:uncharacterized ferritin-like protein (DUF455 family)
MQIRQSALDALCLADPQAKCEALDGMTARAARWSFDPAPAPPDRPLPGRPARPRLIDPVHVPARSAFTLEGRAALLHAICHIEFNAINLALDAVWRFDGLPPAFYRDWMQVALEESRHFRMLHTQLQTMGWHYGDFDAHDGLWGMCEKTAGDVIARMALVPRTLEARGLDATPLIQNKLRKVGSADAQTICRLLDVILADEIGHVEIGNRWYRWTCERAGLDPLKLYPQLALRYQAPRLRPPFNTRARQAAGFTPQELDGLLGA